MDDFRKVEIKSTLAHISQYIWEHTKKRDGLQRYKNEGKIMRKEIYFVTWLKKRKKRKFLCLLQEFFLRFLNLCTTKKKKMLITCSWGYPFIVLVRESLIATKTHLVKTRLARKRSQNKEGFIVSSFVLIGITTKNAFLSHIFVKRNYRWDFEPSLWKMWLHPKRIATFTKRSYRPPLKSRFPMVRLCF